MKSSTKLFLWLLLCVSPVPGFPQGREDEIVANLAAGRVIVHVTKDGIAFATIQQSAEADSIPPRIVALDSTHVGVMLGAAEWVLPGQGSKPIRIEKGIPRLGSGAGVRQEQWPGVEMDLQRIGEAYLESLRPLVERLHHKIELGPDEPLFELLVIGYGPEAYGPEVWLYEFRVEQERLVGDYMKTRLLRPRSTQLYPPEKHQPKTLVEVRYPPDEKGPTVQAMVLQNDPAVMRLASSDPRFEKVVERLRVGQANGAKFGDAADFLQAVAFVTAGKARFAVGKFEENRGLAWVVPPDEPVEKAKEDKNRPPEAPSLTRKP